MSPWNLEVASGQTIELIFDTHLTFYIIYYDYDLSGKIENYPHNMDEVIELQLI